MRNKLTKEQQKELQRKRAETIAKRPNFKIGPYQLHCDAENYWFEKSNGIHATGFYSTIDKNLLRNLAEYHAFHSSDLSGDFDEYLLKLRQAYDDFVTKNNKTIDDFDYFILHLPYPKMAHYAIASLMIHHLRNSKKWPKIKLPQLDLRRIITTWLSH